MTLKLNVVIASTRPGRIGPKVAGWVADFASQNSDFEVELVDLADFDLPLIDETGHPRAQAYEHEHTKRWSASAASADAFVFVTPEYDYFAPASLVNALQVLAAEWGYKPAGLVGYGGISGGLRAIQGEKLLMANLGMMPVPQEVPVPMVWDYLGEDGVFTPSEPIADGTRGMLGELHKWAGALKPLREDREERKAA